MGGGGSLGAAVWGPTVAEEGPGRKGGDVCGAAPVRRGLERCLGVGNRSMPGMAA